MKKISLSIPEFQWKLGDKGALDVAHELGLSYVDLDLSYHFTGKENDIYNSLSKENVVRHFEDVKKHADSLGVTVCQTHGRIRAYKYNDSDFNAKQKESAELDILATKALGAKYCVMHAVHLPPEEAPEHQRELNDLMFNDFLKIAHRENIMIANETLGAAKKADGGRTVDFFGNCEEFTASLDRFLAMPEYSGSLCVCMDTGHSHRAAYFEGQPSCPELIRRLGSNIKCLHLNDNDGIEDMHLAPRMGNADWNEIMAALHDINYDGVYNMELDLRRFGYNVPMMKQYAAFAISIMDSML